MFDVFFLLDALRAVWARALVFVSGGTAAGWSGVSVVLALLFFLALCWFSLLFARGIAMGVCLRRIPQVRGKLPLVGHAPLLMRGLPSFRMADWSLNPHMCVDTGRQAKKQDALGINRLVRFSVFHHHVVYINDPVLIKRVLLTNQRNYIKDIAFSYKHFMCLLGEGLVTSEGEKWRKGRLLLSHALRVDILEDISEMAMKAVGRIMGKLMACDDKTPFVDLNEEFRHMTLQVIGEMVLSLQPEETDRIFSKLYIPIVYECNRRVWEPWRTWMIFSEGFQTRRRSLRQLNETLEDIIKKRWEEGHKATDRDIMALCMSQVQKMDAAMLRQLRDDVKTILLAGHETSAALLTWATYEVISHPEVRDKIVEEAKVLFDPARCKGRIVTPHGRTWGVPTASDVRRTLVWSPATLRETLRKHCVIPLVMRRTVKSDRWLAAETGLDGDVVIPAGCSVAVGIQAVHHRPDIWPEPGVFDPRRFIGAEIANDTNAHGNEKHEKVIDPYAFIPFINGPRNCLGQHVSIMETEVALAYLFLNWDLRFHGEAGCASDVERLSLRQELGRPHELLIPIVPRKGLKVVGTPSVQRQGDGSDCRSKEGEQNS